jgi:hypothetical protein
VYPCAVTVAGKGDGRADDTNGQIFVYAANGSELGVVKVPERPLQLLADGDTLFILTHHSLYSLDLAN